ncbi:MAG TPA: heme-binding protein [Jiangellaceae bacterium]|nr:heme-binding protein [Jiangellaceae bacterium]
MAGVVNTPDVTMEAAEAIEQACLRKARELGLLMNVAVVDVGGNLKAFARMDGAWLGSIDVAIKKARTARYFDMQSGDLGPMAQPGQPLYHIEFSNGGLITFPGGIPLQDRDGVVVGAVGVSGSTVDNDQAVAQAGVSAFEAESAR